MLGNGRQQGLTERVACKVSKWMLLTEMHLFMSSVLSEAKSRTARDDLLKNRSWVKFPALVWVRAAFHTLVEDAACHPNAPCSFQHHAGGGTAGSGTSAWLLRAGKQEGQSEQCLRWDRGSNIQVRIANITPSVLLPLVVSSMA